MQLREDAASGTKSYYFRESITNLQRYLFINQICDLSIIFLDFFIQVLIN